jgi:outer membrane receptor protein involved in Fe transport
LGANWYYTTQYAPTVADRGLNGETFRFPTKAHGRLSLSAAWRSEDEKLKLTAFGNNVTNARYAIQYQANSFGNFREYAEPATWGVRLDYNFF